MTGGWFIISVLVMYGLAVALWHWVTGQTSELEVQASEKPGSGPEEEAEPPTLCISCLEKLPSQAPFCPACGHATGLYNNVSPYLYIFSMGECLRAGTTGRVRPTLITVLGYFFLSLIQYQIFAPIYWYQMMRNWQRQQNASPPTTSAASA